MGYSDGGWSPGTRSSAERQWLEKAWREGELGRAIEAWAGRDHRRAMIVALKDRLSSREREGDGGSGWDALEQAQARLGLCRRGARNTVTGDHEMLLTIKAAIAREQARTTSQSTRDEARLVDELNE